MADSPRDDDPTRALDGFLQRQARQVEADASAPDLGDLMAKLHPERAAAAAAAAQRPRGGVLKDGTAWTADDVEDVPVVELPRVRQAPESAADVPTPTIDLPAIDTPDRRIDAAVAASTGQATALAAAMWLAEARAAQGPAPQPDLQQIGTRREPHPRLAAQWRPGTWIAAKRPVVPATTEILNTAGGPVIETYPAQHLVVLWSPLRSDAPHLGRWPRKAFLSADPEDRLDDAAIAHVPDDRPLWWLPADSDLVDWGLVGQIVQIHETTLRPFQLEALKGLIETEREAAFSEVNDGYHRPVSGEPVQRRP